MLLLWHSLNQQPLSPHMCQMKRNTINIALTGSPVLKLALNLSAGSECHKCAVKHICITQQGVGVGTGSEPVGTEPQCHEEGAMWPPEVSKPAGWQCSFSGQGERRIRPTRKVQMGTASATIS